jgi:UDP-N-acetylglucosamine/UDP-N-acetylgalactosamine diphosphorylase
MDFQPKSHKKIRQLIERGVEIPNPGTLDIGEEVNADQISEKGVKIYPGCRIYGSRTVISSGCKLGYEAPVTIEDCQLGSAVELKGGFFSKSVFLDKANMGMGAHVREGCILEEQVSGAHSVGLKQTILFPFVTLGSLINFCDCFMAGGTSRDNHSEVGSSYIHFNFTPDADKTTPSLIGDVPRGVMLNQPPIFLGGQGGIIGPMRLGYGNVVAAGSILRHDYSQDNQLIFEKAPASSVKDYIPATYPGIDRVVENNILYVANLTALEEWYTHIRKPFLGAQPFGLLLYDGVMEQLSAAKKERLQKLKTMAQKAGSPSLKQLKSKPIGEKQALHKHMKDIEDVLCEKIQDDTIGRAHEEFLQDFRQFGGNDPKPYIETIQKLPPKVSAKGVGWLQSIIDYYCQRISTVIPSLKLFRTF